MFQHVVSFSKLERAPDYKSSVLRTLKLFSSVGKFFAFFHKETEMETQLCNDKIQKKYGLNLNFVSDL